MAKYVKIGLIIAAVAVNVVPGLGQAVSGALFGAALTGASAVGVGLTSALTFAAAVSSTALITTLGVAAALGELQGALTPNPKIQLSQLERLNATVQPSTGRKIVFGSNVAMATDIRYVEPSGTDQEYLDYIICVAAHRVTAIKKLWLDDKLAWSSTGGVQGDYVGYLTVDTRLEGTASNTIAINGGAKWGSTRRLTGCAYIHLRIKRTGNSKKAESPFAGGLTSRMTIIGDGMPVYDPRLDSTAGGSGSQRADNQATWAFDAGGNAQGSNTALQALSYQIGWRIGGRISVGIGTPSARIDLDDYIEAANECDASVATSAGTQKRYTTQAVFSETDGPQAVLSALMQSCNGAMRDTGGKLGLRVRHNDLATWRVDLTDDDVLTSGTWEPVPELAEAYNVVRGRYCDPSDASLYQQVDYPEVRLDSYDGQDRILSLDLPLIDNAARAQRIAKQVLESLQYRGKFTATFGARAWNAKVGQVVRLSLSPAGWNQKLFRVESQSISMTGQCQMLLREENAAVYQWDADDRAPVTAAAPTVYDPLNNPFILAISEAYQQALDAIAAAENAQDTADGKIDTFYQNSPPSAAGEGDLWFDLDDGNKLYTYRSGVWVVTQDTKIGYAISAAAGAQATADGKVTTFYTTSTPTAEAVGDLWYNTSTKLLKRWSGSSWIDVATFGANWATTLFGTPTSLTDGRVDAGLNSDGTVKGNRVSTPSIIDNSVSQSVLVSMIGSITGSSGYAWQDLAYYTVTLPYEAEIHAFGDVQNAYSSGALPIQWQIRLVIDGTTVRAKGGAGFGTDCAGIIGFKTCSAGNRTVRLQGRADNAAFSIVSADLSILAPMK